MTVEAVNADEAKYLVIEKVKAETGCHAFHAKARLVK